MSDSPSKHFCSNHNLRLAAIFLATNVVAGCSVNPQYAAKLSTLELCKQAFTPGTSDRNRSTLLTVVAQRGESCEPHLQTVVQMIQLEQQELERRAAALQALGQALQEAGKPRQAPPSSQPSSIRCRIVRNPYGDRINCFAD
jgi:hypothetical protein